MHRLMEPNAPVPDISRGTLEGRLLPGPMTLFRLQGTSDGKLASYVAEGHVLDIDPKSFGGIGVIGIANFARFYRNVLIARHFPHHAATAFAHCGRALFDAVQMLGVKCIGTPLPAGVAYPGENVFVI